MLINFVDATNDANHYTIVSIVQLEFVSNDGVFIQCVLYRLALHDVCV